LERFSPDVGSIAESSLEAFREEGNVVLVYKGRDTWTKALLHLHLYARRLAAERLLKSGNMGRGRWATAAQILLGKKNAKPYQWVENY